jgi:hypothetical protein
MEEIISTIPTQKQAEVILKKMEGGTVYLSAIIKEVKN